MERCEKGTMKKIGKREDKRREKGRNKKWNKCKKKGEKKKTKESGKTVETMGHWTMTGSLKTIVMKTSYFDRASTWSSMRKA